ncbi:putative metallo-hydrolase YflN [Paenibacillus allorhizoplanae]|uniref:Metallo-hydrolase YflN n=1 Tax=Paenibacillus allorhizoplanae TaxID=2905648 RepID=A0ABM9BXV3_9BACL|nr:MBL fold metallo-hydrolase [Paenibacillus allorhizoplanae]CAH1196201.1 putative metallo-hydrolase YflN [Paenibacillus allorhizoplanae]
MQISEGLYSVDLSVPLMGRINVIYPALFLDEQGAVLVDTGYPGTLPLLHKTIKNLGVDASTLDSVILTHQDIDHIGGLPALLEDSSHPLEVFASELEKPYIQGDKMLIKVTPASIERAVANLPADTTPEWRDAFRRNLENPPKAPVTTILEDGQVLDRCGGIVVILTPGHTPGHLSLYHKKSKTLIAADSMVVAEGELQGPIPAYCADYPLALQSLRKYLQFDIEQVLCYHGGLITDNVNQRIAEIVNSMEA